MRYFLSYLILALALPAVVAAQAGGSCIDYWSVGPSGCDGSRPPVVVATPPVVPPVPQPAPVARTNPANKPLDPVEEFYQTYDKPPRAFVEFQLNPTPTNALAWVKEYQTIINKSSETAAAWRQAEVAIEQYQQTGQLPQNYTQALSDEERKQVTNILLGGVPKPFNFSDNPTPSDLPPIFQAAVLGNPVVVPPAQPAAPAPNKLDVLNRGSRTTTDKAPPAADRLSIATLNKGEDKTDSDVVKVNYYFSAVCPFCRRFEPELAKVQQQFNAKRLDVTCVDMTPGTRAPENKQAGIDCRWRPLGPGEKDANQVRATPSLLIDFGPTKSLELVEGYVAGTELLSYLNQKVSE